MHTHSVYILQAQRASTRGNKKAAKSYTIVSCGCTGIAIVGALIEPLIVFAAVYGVVISRIKF